MLQRKIRPRRTISPKTLPRVTFSETEEALADPWFNPYRVPATEPAWRVVREVAGKAQVLEGYRQLRQRKRRADDQKRFEDIVAAVVADLMHHHLSGGHGAGLVVSRSKKVLAKRSRYRPSILTELFITVMDLLAAPEMDFVEQDIAKGSRQETRRTTIKAGSRLVARIADYQLNFADLAIADSAEVILLKDKRRIKDDGREDYFDQADLIEYRDTPKTRQFRDEVHRINARLKGADIAFDRETAKRGVVDPALIRSIDHVDPSVRQLRRYFSRGSFESGGRLFGAFWQNLERQARLRGLRINGEAVISLDYSQFNPLLAYSIAGQLPPPDDAYTMPGLEQHRERVKRVFNSMMFSTTPLKKFPKGVRAQSRLGDVTANNEPFPASMRIEDVTEAIIKKHPALTKLFYAGTGHRMMFEESQIMMQVLLKLGEQSVVALPVFDAVVVQATNEAKARAAMQEAFQAGTGLTATIKREVAT